MTRPNDGAAFVSRLLGLGRGCGKIPRDARGRVDAWIGPIHCDEVETHFASTRTPRPVARVVIGSSYENR